MEEKGGNMATNGPWARQYDLSYDKIIKRTPDRCDELTARFIKGLFGGGIPLDAAIHLNTNQNYSNAATNAASEQ
jgi:hypothetical protein